VVTAARAAQLGTSDGDKRSKIEVVADEVGPSLRWATAQITRMSAWTSEGARAAADRPLPRPRRRPRLRIRRGALLVMARSNYRGGTRRAPKDLNRRVKKKPCAMCRDKVEWVDYKDVNALRKYMSDRGKIRSRRVTGNCASTSGHRRGHQDGS